MTYTKSLLVFVLITTLMNEGQMANWLSDLNNNLQSLGEEIQQTVKNVQKGVETNVQRTVTDINNISPEVHAEIQEAIKNGAVSSIIAGANCSIVTLTSPGVTRKITSGTLPDGKPFLYDVQNKVIGKYLYHTEKHFNDTNKGIQVTGYKLDLSDSNASPIPFY